jgi:NAD(P)H dehydrogenase (quinone)
MNSMPELAITGSNGNIGGTVARFLADAGVPQRLLVRDARRAPDLQGAATAVLDYADPVTSRMALDGVKTLFMVSIREAPDRVEKHFTFVDAAAEAGVQHIVYTSFFRAAEDAVFTLAREHFATEERIRASGMDYTFLRNDFFLDSLPLLAGPDGVIRGPAGEGVLAAVAREDVARCAVTVLRDPALHINRVYELTGPEDLSLREVAALLTEGTGRTITYVPETIEEAYASREHYHVEQWQLDAWVSTYLAIAQGQMAGPTSAVRELTGRQPLSLRELLQHRTF